MLLTTVIMEHISSSINKQPKEDVKIYWLYLVKNRNIFRGQSHIISLYIQKYKKDKTRRNGKVKHYV